MDRAAIHKCADSANRVERRKAERLYRISHVLKPGAVFYTGMGKVNRVVIGTSKRLCIRAEGGKTVSISVVQIKKMIAYFMRIRVVERKELEAFHSHSSAMFGLLAAIYNTKAKVNRVWCGTNMSCTRCSSAPKKNISLSTLFGKKVKALLI